MLEYKLNLNKVKRKDLRTRGRSRLPKWKKQLFEGVKKHLYKNVKTTVPFIKLKRMDIEEIGPKSGRSTNERTILARRESKLGTLENPIMIREEEEDSQELPWTQSIKTIDVISLFIDSTGHPITREPSGPIKHAVPQEELTWPEQIDQWILENPKEFEIDLSSLNFIEFESSLQTL